MQSTYMLSPVRLTVCLSVRPSHRCVSQKRLKLGKCNFHHSVAQSGCVKQAWDEENKLFSSFLVYISKKEVAYALSIGNKVDDIGWPWTAISSSFLGILHYFALLGEHMFVVDGVTVKNASEGCLVSLCPIYQGCRALTFELAKLSCVSWNVSLCFSRAARF